MTSDSFDTGIPDLSDISLEVLRRLKVSTEDEAESTKDGDVMLIPEMGHRQ